MSRECPMCHTVSSEWQYKAWTVQAHGTVRFSDTGAIDSLGPAVAVTVVKPGKELTGAGTRLICMNCRHEAGIKAFPLVVPSFISGERSNTTVFLSLLDMHVPIVDSEINLLEQIFSAESIAWSTPASIIADLASYVATVMESTSQ